MAQRGAAGRVGRIRWTMTAVFAVATLLGLLVLAGIAAHIDSDSRQHELDADLRQRARSLTSTARTDDGAPVLDDLLTDSVARTTSVFAVVQHGTILLAQPDQDSLPADAVIGRLVRGAGRATIDAPSVDGAGYAWAARSVPGTAASGTVVIVGDPTAASSAAHVRLLAGLLGTVLALTVLAGIVGHLLSGRAMRPLLRGLAAQEQFLVEAAHELRTPLSTMRLTLERGLRRPEEAPSALRRSMAQTDRLGRLVAGLLIRARVEAGTQSVPMDLLRLDQVVDVTAAEVEAVGVGPIALRLEPVVVLGSSDLLAQAVRNLLENAHRYAGAPTVTVAGRRLEVADDGPGIDPARRSEVLRRGVGSGAGTGTGLAIVAWVAQLHDAALALDQTPGGGLTVSITFPEPASSSLHDPRRTLEP